MPMFPMRRRRFVDGIEGGIDATRTDVPPPVGPVMNWQGQLAGMGAPKGEPEKLGGGGMVRSAAGGSATPGAAGGGFGGMFMRKNLPRTLGVIGAGLRQIGGEAPDAINDFVAAEQAARDEQMQRDIFGMRMRSQKTETQQGQDREQLVQEFIASLPAEQQLRARAAYLTDPEGFASQYLLTGSSDWQNNGTVPYRIDPATGAVITGSGTIPHRPRQPLIQYGSAGDEADWEYGE